MNEYFTPEILERFFLKIEEDEHGCWIWKASGNDAGYGQFFPVKGVRVYVHRFSYLYFIGEIPERHEIEHECRNRGCVNPFHLDVLTHIENCRRGTAGEKSKLRPKPTHCPQGHEYTAENTLRWSVHGGRWKVRRCKSCEEQRMADRRSKRQLERTLRGMGR